MRVSGRRGLREGFGAEYVEEVIIYVSLEFRGGFFDKGEAFGVVDPFTSLCEFSNSSSGFKFSVHSCVEL